MDQNIDYKELYKLQDKILKIIFSIENEFYLTGGTCLNRFYAEKRYSNDLDLFSNNSNRFNFAVKNIVQNLQLNYTVKLTVETKDFVRIIVNNLLQIDFVNERTPYYKSVVVTDDNYIIDNLENILTNKLSAVLGRDNPKDVFDIFLIYKIHNFSWVNILEATHKKIYFSNEELILRLKDFPKDWLSNIKLIDKQYLNDFDKTFDKIINDIKEVAKQQ